MIPKTETEIIYCGIETQKSGPEFFQIEKKIIDPIESASALLEGINNLNDKRSVAEKILSNLADKFEIVHGLFFLLHKKSGEYQILAKYAFSSENDPLPFSPGEGISGQAAADQKITVLKNIPDQYFLIQSGLGKSKPSFIYIIPIINGKGVIGVIEISTFRELTQDGLDILSSFSRNNGKQIVQTFSGLKI